MNGCSATGVMYVLEQIADFFLTLKPLVSLVCAIVVFDHDWNELNHSCASSSLSAFIYAFSSNCVYIKISAVRYGGISLNFSNKYVLCWGRTAFKTLGRRFQEKIYNLINNFYN
jgi:hypothetical protein